MIRPQGVDRLADPMLKQINRLNSARQGHRTNRFTNPGTR
jgi:hypothetical protein